MAFVTCKYIGEALINWLNVNGSEAVCEALDCPDARLKSASFDEETGVITMIVGYPGTTVGDSTVTVTIPPQGMDICAESTAASVRQPQDEVLVCRDGNVRRVPTDLFLAPLCDSPTVPELQAGDGVVTCRDGSTVLVDPNAFFQDVCFNDVPDMGTVCAVGQQLTLWNDNGCMRLGRISSASAQGMAGGLADVWTHFPVNTVGLAIPTDFVDPDLFYTVGNHNADGGVDTNRYEFPNGANVGNRRAAPGMNEAMIVNSRIARFEGTLACSRVFDWTANFTASDTVGATFEQLHARRVTVGIRVRQQVAGMTGFSPWLYAFAPGPGTLALSGTQNSVGTQATLNGVLNLTAGDYEVEFYYVTQSSSDHYIAAANTHQQNYAAQAPYVALRPRVTA